jgi:hypothetical protein
MPNFEQKNIVIWETFWNEKLADVIDFFVVKNVDKFRDLSTMKMKCR